MVDPGAGNYFIDAGGDPYALLEAGCRVQRESRQVLASPIAGSS